MKKQDLIILSIIITALVLVRVFGNIPNFNPLGAVALMGGMFLGRKAWAYALPLGALFIGDLLLAGTSAEYGQYLFSSSFVFVYVAFALIILLGSSLAKKVNIITVLGSSIIAAVAFFLITNAGSWLALDVYPKSFAGLMSAYEAGIPFFRTTLISQVVFSLAIYIVFSLATSRKLEFAK